MENVSPGPATERFLTQTMRVTRLWGALLVAILATAAQYFDVLCDKTMGTSLGSVSLLLIVGLINSCIRQVCLMQLNCLCLLRLLKSAWGSMLHTYLECLGITMFDQLLSAWTATV